jgi:DNA-binding transcriptional LysR family regulator
LGGFTSASKELHITQPAVYMQVQQLQDNIGAKIFNIKGKKITPTFMAARFMRRQLKLSMLLRIQN